VQLIVRKWEKKKRLPDAIVIEHPKKAGGHLGAAKVEDLGTRGSSSKPCCHRCWRSSKAPVWKRRFP
jgi:NAD(P)H-dependent flavin oxidoreductase YrpB (nitropropane dioxygenase family)